MAYALVPEPEAEAPHPRLEPVSAWLFRGGSPFLAAAGLRQEETALFTMPIDAGGFDPSIGGMWRNYALSDLPLEEKAHYFAAGPLEENLRLLDSDVPDPRVYVLPLPRDSINPDHTGLERPDIGSPRAGSDALPDTPPKAIIGIIDHGINIFHARFRSGRFGSRIASAWLQSAPRDQDRLPFGHEWLRRDIVAAQQAQGSDDETLLRLIGSDGASGMGRSLSHPSSHGTHVLDLAAGMEPDDPRGMDYPIIAVTLPPSVTRETSGSMLALPFLLGLEYILDRARRYMTGMQHPAPVFVNFSFGLSGGPRRGAHRLERSVHRMAERHVAKLGDGRTDGGPPPRVFVAAGNRNLARGHAQAPARAGQMTVAWHLQPADRTSNFIEFRIETHANRPPRAITVRLRPPDAVADLTRRIVLQPDNELAAACLVTRGTAAIGRVSVQRETGQPSILTVALAPTDPGARAAAAAAPGDWQIGIEVEGARVQQIDAWILRDDVPPGFHDNAGQSTLVDPAYAARDARGFPLDEDPAPIKGLVRRAGSLNALATGALSDAPEALDPIEVVGAYRGRADADIRPAGYSATPHTAKEERIDSSAQADRSPVLAGVRAAGTRPGTTTVLNGTSVAAPQILRQRAIGDGAWLTGTADTGNTRLGADILAPRPERGRD